MNWKLSAGLLLLVVAQIAFADSTIQQAQEALKEQGFYFGQITGEKNADTMAAIRRFQIRNGLQVTGELNDETLRALNSNSAATVQTATPAPPRIENREPEQNDDLRDEAPPPTGPIAPGPPRAHEIYPIPRAEPSGDVFCDTPYATAPAQLQRQVLLGVEVNLRRRELYRGPIDGAFGPELESALRAYQSRIGLVATGRLDMDTLASLGLLPGQRGPRLPPRRYQQEEPVHGEWIH
jgi:peptidoglycan hydrolase-like protein with peptidoglycan-binding domain